MSITLPTWRTIVDTQLERHAHLPHSRFVQVATVRTDGRPANRTLTFRFFLDDGRLLFTADTRTEKAGQLVANPWAEACWYFTESRMQVRLLGTMQLNTVSTDEELALARQRTWQDRSSESRQSFTWPDAGQSLGAAELFSKTAPDLPPENFALLILTPERVDILDLTSSPHKRTIHTLEHGDWRSLVVNP